MSSLTSTFTALGEALNPGEHATLAQYLEGLGVRGAATCEVADWREARALINRADWDQRLWQAEQSERARLLQSMATRGSEIAALEALSDTLHGAAAVAAARMGGADAGVIRAAAGAATEAAYLAELARRAAAPSTHPYLCKFALFEGGHWPLVLIDNHYYIF